MTIFSSCSKRDDSGTVTSGEKQLYYVKAVETKSHVAFFVTNKTTAADFTDYNGGMTIPGVTGSGVDRHDGFGAVREEFAIDLSDLRVMIVGAGGGAGRAVAVQCAVEDCERLVLVNRTAEKAEAVATEPAPYFDDERVAGAVKRLSVCSWETEALREELDNIDLIVNATSIGMKRTDPELLPQHLLQPHHLAFDMIYSPLETKFLKAARANGARTTNGLPMLLWQGVFSFEWWFNRDAPVEAMRKGLLQAAGAA